MDGKFVLTQGAGQKLEFAVQRNGGTAEDIEWLSAGDNFRAVTQLRTGKADLTIHARGAAPLDTVIRIDRSAPLVYPDWVKKVMHPEFENTGPSEYGLSAVDLWLHDGQKNGGSVTGTVVYEYLKKNGLLKTCLGLRDGLEIQKKGPKVFRKFFGGKYVFLWKSVVLRRDGDLRVPYLYGHDGLVVMYWLWLGRGWYGRNPAARSAISS